MVFAMEKMLIMCTIVLYVSVGCMGIKCYQCGTDPESKNDICGAYERFDKDTNVAIDCNDEDSKMPGSFCLKRTEQGPLGFIWDGRWRQVIRRCASVAETGVTDVCNWGIKQNGDYWQECYCSKDSCNGASAMSVTWAALIITVATFLSAYFAV